MTTQQLDPKVIEWYILAETSGEFDYLKLECDEPQDVANVVGLLEYFFSGPLAVGSEYHLEEPNPNNGPVSTASIFQFWIDSTKSRRDDIFDALYQLPSYLEEGTPARKTNRTGPIGSRAFGSIIGGYQLYFGNQTAGPTVGTICPNCDSIGGDPLRRSTTAEGAIFVWCPDCSYCQRVG